jgi:hypothetical protein
LITQYPDLLPFAGQLEGIHEHQACFATATAHTVPRMCTSKL